MSTEACVGLVGLCTISLGDVSGKWCQKAPAHSRGSAPSSRMFLVFATCEDMLPELPAKIPASCTAFVTSDFSWVTLGLSSNSLP